MEDKTYTVYLHINPKNKKVYVGITNQNVYKRWKNGHGYTKCKKFYNTEEAKKKISNAGKRPCSKETKRKIGLANRGSNNGMYGKTISDYARRVIIERFSKPVLQLDLDNNIINRFSSASEAERYLGGKGSHVGCCCLGKRKTAYGYRWKYE